MMSKTQFMIICCLAVIFGIAIGLTGLNIPPISHQKGYELGKTHNIKEISR